MNNKELIIIIPAYNEEKNIKKVITSFQKFCEILVIDDCSSDRTGKIAEKYSDYYIKNKNNIGYDFSLRKAFKYVLKNLKNKKFIVTCDGDGQHTAQNLKSLFKYLNNKDFSILLGKRDKFNRISEHVISFFSKKFLNIDDPYTGLKIYRIVKIKKKFLNLKFNIDTIGLFFLLICKKNEIKEKKIFIKKKNKKSSFGDGISINFKLIKTFLWIYFRFLFKN